MREQQAFLGLNSISNLKTILEKENPNKVLLVIQEELYKSSGASSILPAYFKDIEVEVFYDIKSNPDISQIKKGIDLAVSEYNDKGIDINVIYEDDQSLSQIAAVNAANKLLNIDKVDIGLTMLVEESRSIAPIFNKKEIPLLLLWDSNNFIQGSGDYIFSNGFSTELAGESMADFAYNDLGLRTVAIIGHIDPWADIITRSFKDKFEIMGAELYTMNNLI